MGVVSFRKAKGFDGVERDWTPGELHRLYCRGVTDGAGSKGIRADHEHIRAYMDGWSDGKQAVRELLMKHAESVGYVPTILRAQ